MSDFEGSNQHLEELDRERFYNESDVQIRKELSLLRRINKLQDEVWGFKRAMQYENKRGFARGLKSALDAFDESFQEYGDYGGARTRVDDMLCAVEESIKYLDNDFPDMGEPDPEPPEES